MPARDPDLAGKLPLSNSGISCEGFFPVVLAGVWSAQLPEPHDGVGFLTTPSEWQDDTNQP